jgi:HD-GYP domain-containing protein (c-di-GMP phosphodiesterase class II)
MAVADIFTAITEDRPYRKGMTYEKATEVMKQMVDKGDISSSVFNLLMENYEAIYDIRKKSAEKAVEEYSKILSIDTSDN